LGRGFVAVVINGFIFYISLFCSVSVQAVYEIFRIVFFKVRVVGEIFLENSGEVGKSGIWRIFSGCSEKRLGTRTKAVKNRTWAENEGNDYSGSTGVRKRTRFRSARNTVASPCLGFRTARQLII